MTLVELGFFGDPGRDMKVTLAQAFDDYRAWCKVNKVVAGLLTAWHVRGKSGHQKTCDTKRHIIGW